MAGAEIPQNQGPHRLQLYSILIVRWQKHANLGCSRGGNMQVYVDRRAFCAGTIVGLFASAPSFAEPKRLKDSLPARGKVLNPRFFGAAARFEQLEKEPALEALYRSECQWITPEIDLKWDALEWAEGQFSFQPADNLIRYATRNGINVRGHTLLWDQSTPRWAKKRLERERDWRLIERHFDVVLRRYQAQVSEWDVINEPIDSDEADGFRRNCFHKAFGSSYISRAMHLAREKAPGVRLAINDYGFDYDNPVEEKRRSFFLKMLEKLKQADVPINSVGIQAHLDLAKGPLKQGTLDNFFKALAALELDVVITELDVKEHDLNAPLHVRDERVAKEVREYLEVALSHDVVRGVITWGLTDRDSWLQDQLNGGRPKKLEGLNRGLPYDAGFRSKPLLQTIRAALQPGTTPLRKSE